MSSADLVEQLARRLWRAGQESPFAHGDEMSMADESFMDRVARECLRQMEWVIKEQVIASHGDKAEVRDHGVLPTLAPEDWKP